MKVSDGKKASDIGPSWVMARYGLSSASMGHLVSIEPQEMGFVCRHKSMETRMAG